MRFAYMDSQGNEVAIPSVDALALRIELGAIRADTELYDAQADRWGPAHTHDIFHTLSRHAEEEGFVAPPPAMAPPTPSLESPPTPSLESPPTPSIEPPPAEEVVRERPMMWIRDPLTGFSWSFRRPCTFPTTNSGISRLICSARSMNRACWPNCFTFHER